MLSCLCVWVLTSVDDATVQEATAHLDDAPQHHDWTLYDLSIIWRTLLSRGHIRPLLRGFELFQRVKPEGDIKKKPTLKCFFLLGFFCRLWFLGQMLDQRVIQLD